MVGSTTNQVFNSNSQTNLIDNMGSKIVGVRIENFSIDQSGIIVHDKTVGRIE